MQAKPQAKKIGMSSPRNQKYSLRSGDYNHQRHNIQIQPS